MKTKVTQTSRDCYHNLELTEQQKTVLRTITLLKESCISDTATYLKWERSTVSGRFNELKNLHLIIFTEKKKSETTGINSEFYKPNNYKLF